MQPSYHGVAVIAVRAGIERRVLWVLGFLIRKSTSILFHFLLFLDLFLNLRKYVLLFYFKGQTSLYFIEVNNILTNKWKSQGVIIPMKFTTKVMKVMTDLLKVLNEKRELLKRVSARGSYKLFLRNSRKIFFYVRPMFKSISYFPCFFLVYYILLVIGIPILVYLRKVLTNVTKYIWAKIKQFLSPK